MWNAIAWVRMVRRARRFAQPKRKGDLEAILKTSDMSGRQHIVIRVLPSVQRGSGSNPRVKSREMKETNS